MSELCRLPEELVCEILEALLAMFWADSLVAPKPGMHGCSSVNAVALTCRKMHRIATPALMHRVYVFLEPGTWVDDISVEAHETKGVLDKHWPTCRSYLQQCMGPATAESLAKIR